MVGLHRVIWDLKQESKTTEEAATRVGVTTISEREALDWVAPGTYTATLETSNGSLKTGISVRKEGQGLNRVEVRK